MSRIVQEAAKTFQAQLLKHLSPVGSGRPPVQDPLAGYEPTAVLAEPSPVVEIINSATPSSSNNSIEYFTRHLPARHKRKAREMLLKIKSNFPADLSFDEKGTVFINGDSMPETDIKELLAATFNSRKKATGLNMWLDKLHDLGLDNYVNSKRKTIQEEKDSDSSIDKQWWCLV